MPRRLIRIVGPELLWPNTCVPASHRGDVAMKLLTVMLNVSIALGFDLRTRHLLGHLANLHCAPVP